MRYITFIRQKIIDVILITPMIRRHPNNTNRDSGIEIPEAWIPTIKKHNSRSTSKQTCGGTTSNRIEMHQYQRTNMLQIATRKQSTSSPDEDQQYCSRNVAINNSKRFHRETNGETFILPNMYVVKQQAEVTYMTWYGVAQK